MKTITITSKIKIQKKKHNSSIGESVSNPNTKSISFILTDNRPNGNGIGIKMDEFMGLAYSSVFMPIKSMRGQYKQHEGSFPVGVITSASIEDNKILGEGILWPEESPVEVQEIKNLVDQDEAYLSWEVAYQDVEVSEDVRWLKNPMLLATTLVTDPAYRGRTKIIEMSKLKNDLETSDMSSEEMENDVEIEETPELDDEVEEPTDTEETVEELDKVEEPEDEETKDTGDETDEELKDELQKELEELRQFKEEVEKQRKITQRKEEISENFGDVSEDLFSTMLDFSAEQFEAITTVAPLFKEKSSGKEESGLNSTVPELPTEVRGDSVEVLVEFLNSQNGGNDGN
jgi:molecular chaperone GrpE (heat shock protein)